MREKNNARFRARPAVFAAAAVFIAAILIALLMPQTAEAIERPYYKDNPPAYQYKDVFSTEKVTIPAGTIPVENIENDNRVTDHEFKFEIYNSTLQRTEGTVTTKDGYLPELTLNDNFNYIFFLPYDDTYRIAKSTDNLYIWVRNGQLVDIKSYLHNKNNYEHSDTGYYSPVESIQVSPYNPKDSRRYNGGSYDTITVKDYNGNTAEAGVEITFTSESETVKARTDEDGIVHPNLLEDVNYMVSTNDPRYDIDPFPIAVKDKSEYDSSKFFYDHSSCHRVGLKYTKNDKVVNENPIVLFKKGDIHHKDTTMESLSGNTTAKGMNFKDLIIVDQKSDRKVDKLDQSGKDYDVFDIAAVNPHRWEYCKMKLATGRFTITEKTPGRTASAVYYIDNSGKLQEAANVKASRGQVSFDMDSMSLYPIVIEYTDVQQATPKVKLSKTSYTYTGKSVKPALTVSASGEKLNSDSYDLSYPSGQTSVGIHQVSVTLKGDFTGTSSASFRIVPKSVTVKSLKASKKKFTLSWKPQGKSTTTGYQIQYSTSKSFHSAKTSKVGSYKTAKKSVSKLKAKKKYYVRIRAYKKTSAGTVYSSWSKSRTVRTK